MYIDYGIILKFFLHVPNDFAVSDGTFQAFNVWRNYFKGLAFKALTRGGSRFTCAENTINHSPEITWTRFLGSDRLLNLLAKFIRFFSTFFIYCLLCFSLKHKYVYKHKYKYFYKNINIISYKCCTLKLVYAVVTSIFVTWRIISRMTCKLTSNVATSEAATWGVQSK